MEVSFTWQCNAIAASVANSTTFLFNTGSAPGMPRQTGHTLLFGAAPNRVEHEQKILVAVSNWTCTSSPITGSNRVSLTTDVSGTLTISSDYKTGRCLRHRLGRRLKPGRLSFQNLFVGIHRDLPRLAGQQHIHAAGAVADDSDLTQIDHAFA